MKQYRVHVEENAYEFIAANHYTVADGRVIFWERQDKDDVRVAEFNIWRSVKIINEKSS